MMVHSFLIIGQSNMGGRGFLHEALEIDRERLKVLKNGRWQKLFRPVNPDRFTSGVNLSESFAEKYSKEFDVDVGIIPCADGGTCLDQWCVGGLLYDHAVYQTKLALRTSNLAGILWHQGESDCHSGREADYGKKLKVIMESLRKDIGEPDVPIIVGGVGDFIKEYGLNDPTPVNEQLQEFAKKDRRAAFASAKGLGHNGDNLHFNAKALHEFGLRYYDAFKTVYDKDRVFVEKSSPDDAVRSEIESL